VDSKLTDKIPQRAHLAHDIRTRNEKSELNIKQQPFFHWHPQTQLLSISTSSGNNSQQTIPDALGGVEYVVDIDCKSTLRCLRKVLTRRQEFCIHPPQYTPEPCAHDLEHGAFFQCLSAGTNGVPKRIRRSHQSWISSFSINARLAGITSADSYAIIGRLSHSLALYAALEAAHLGADLHVLTEHRPDRQIKAMATMQSSILYATPTQLRLLCQQAKTVTINQLSVRHIFCGGGTLDQATALSVSEVFKHATMQQFYGATETSFIAITDDHTPVGSVGKPYPGVKIAIGDGPNTNEDFSACAPGKIWVNSPYIFQTYIDSSALAAQKQDGYVSVGEIGYFDRDGYLFLSGRESRRVNIADIVVYPEEIEAALHEHPAVSLCAVVPVNDDQRGCALVAAVEGVSSPTLKQNLLVYLRRCVGPLKAPRDIVFITTMPQLPSGKPDLTALELLLSQQSE